MVEVVVVVVIVVMVVVAVMVADLVVIAEVVVEVVVVVVIVVVVATLGHERDVPSCSILASCCATHASPHACDFVHWVTMVTM